MESSNFCSYMNPPECPVSVGDVCLRTDYLVCDIEYKVLSIYEKDGKFYAVCEYTDDFSCKRETEDIFAYYLIKKG